MAGQGEAITLLKEYLGQEDVPDFDAIFSDPKCDHLQPDKVYAGCHRTDADAVEPNMATPPTPESDTVPSVPIHPVTSSTGNHTTMATPLSTDSSTDPDCDADPTHDNPDDPIDAECLPDIEYDKDGLTDLDAEGENYDEEELEEQFATLSNHCEVNPLTKTQVASAYLKMSDYCWTLSGFASSTFGTLSWSASEVDMKSPRDPESRSARTGRPATFATAVIGSGACLDTSFREAAFRSRDLYLLAVIVWLISSSPLSSHVFVIWTTGKSPHPIGSSSILTTL
jgi:hypothetical protein